MWKSSKSPAVHVEVCESVMGQNGHLSPELWWLSLIHQFFLFIFLLRALAQRRLRLTDTMARILSILFTKVF